MREVIIFDFDGTLADTLETGRRIFNLIAPDYGLATIEAERLAELRHLTMRALFKTLGVKQRNLPAILRKGRALLREQIDELSPCPGVLEQLPALSAGSVRCGILTSNSVENVEIFLRRFGVRHFFDFISSCRKLKGKAKYLKAIAKTYSVSPDQMLYVGDEVRDVKACRKAGVPVVAVTWGYNSARALLDSKPNMIVDCPADLGKLLEVPDGVVVPIRRAGI